MDFILKHTLTFKLTSIELLYNLWHEKSTQEIWVERFRKLVFERCPLKLIKIPHLVFYLR